MDASREVAERWLALVNARTSKEEDVMALFSDAAEIHFVKEGRGTGDAAVFAGRKSILEWFRNMPREVVVFSVLEVASCEPRPELPEGDAALRLRYELFYEEIDFRNTGEIWMHTLEGHVVGMLQIPEPLET